MHVKILMCPCYKDYFKAEGHPYIKHIIYFHCKYDQDHKNFVHFYSSHSFGTTIPAITGYTGTIKKKCFCDKEHANSICQYCCSIRYSLNFLCHKICVEDSGYFRDFLKKHKVTPLDKYLKKLPCEPFFYLENNRIIVSLDNPEYFVPHKTDSRPVFYRS